MQNDEELELEVGRQVVSFARVNELSSPRYVKGMCSAAALHESETNAFRVSVGFGETLWDLGSGGKSNERQPHLVHLLDLSFLVLFRESSPAMQSKFENGREGRPASINAKWIGNRIGYGGGRDVSF